MTARSTSQPSNTLERGHVISTHYDVIVLGAGSSGYVAAIRAAQLGKNIQSGSADNGQPQTLSITSVPAGYRQAGRTAVEERGSGVAASRVEAVRRAGAADGRPTRPPS